MTDKWINGLGYNRPLSSFPFNLDIYVSCHICKNEDFIPTYGIVR